MKKWISVILAALLVFSGAALAEEEPQAKLSALAVQVRTFLGLPDDYGNFYGDYSLNGDHEMWQLNWNDDMHSANVTCDGNGKIYSVYVYDSAKSVDWRSEYAPRLPEKTLAQAQTAFEAFLSSVLSENEGYVIDEQTGLSGWQGDVTYACSGHLTRDGIATEVRFNLSLRGSDLSIYNFDRDDCYVTLTPAENTQPALSAEEAKAAFDDVYSAELRYITDADGALRLAYVAVPRQNIVIDAITGEQLPHDNIMPYRVGGGEGDFSAADSGLTPAEQIGVQQMEGVHTQAELDAAARAISELGITDDFDLVSSNFSNQVGQVLVGLNYRKQVENGSISKYVQLDAKDMSLVYCYTDLPYQGSIDYSPDLDAAAQIAQAFLAAYFPDRTVCLLDTSVPNDPWQPVTSVYFVRVENGIIYEDNNINVDVNTDTGYIAGVNAMWTEDLDFPSAQDVGDADEALSILRSMTQTELVNAQFSDFDMWSERLCYRLTGTEDMIGLDAQTLEPIHSASASADSKVVYEDAKDAGDTAKLLADYGIGYAGGAFNGGTNATLRDALTIILSAGGAVTINTGDEQLLQAAHTNGLLVAGEYDLDGEVTRAWFARILVEMSGYGKAASLTDIYNCGFADDAQIPAADLGYIAIAKGMGIATGDSSGSFHPARAITRAEAAEMLYAFLTRNI